MQFKNYSLHLHLSWLATGQTSSVVNSIVQLGYGNGWDNWASEVSMHAKKTLDR